ncbi:MFS transporter [Komagataeibacter sp. FNDCF1]|uniref:MFS transporter n=1 Tax=Komagataeibacter sp. FNDCF1 TaxID=2878681 RepID=UPI001E410F1F|nr:MFS transporter [Komagataeibacter sp. FNDCF1]MCE2563318.1 MFS transporter [Komagataeibacter sp. FNDCF1]
MSEVTAGRDGTGGTAEMRVRYAVLVPLLMAVFLSVLDYAVANIALPTISGVLHITAAQSVWVVNAYQLANAMLLLPLAAWADRIGSARLCQIGLVIIMAGSGMCAVASSFPVLVFARVVQGIGGACVMSVSAALVRVCYPHSRLGEALALNALVTALGFACSPAVAAGILSIASWRWLFLFNIPYGLITLGLTVVSFPRVPVRHTAFDASAAILNMLAFGGILVAGDWLAHGSERALGWGMLVVGLVSLALLAKRQHGQAAPLFPVDLFMIGPLRVAAAVCFMGYVASNFFMISIPFTLTSLFHKTQVTTGLMITLWPLGMMVAGPLVGRLADRVHPGLLAAVGLFVVGTGYMLLRVCPADASTANIIWRFGFAGMGFAFFVAPNNKAIMQAAPLERSRGASAIISLARILGQSTGATLVAFVMTRGGSHASLHCLELGAFTAWGAAGLSASRLLRRAGPEGKR